MMLDGAQAKTGFVRQYGGRLAALTFWAALLAGYWLYTQQHGLTIQESLRQLAAWLTGSVYGPLGFVLLYILRPLLFFPATLATLLGGFLFGPLLGVIYVVVGSNSSAMLAYGVGRYFGQDVLDEAGSGIIRRYAQAMRQNSFETVLVMRLIFLPYDLVHYAAGFLKINWRAFLLATIIGSVPGAISIVLLGASFGTLDDLLAGEAALNPVALIISILLILVSIAISRYLKRKNAVGRD